MGWVLTFSVLGTAMGARYSGRACTFDRPNRIQRSVSKSPRLLPDCYRSVICGAARRTIAPAFVRIVRNGRACAPQPGTVRTNPRHGAATAGTLTRLPRALCKTPFPQVPDLRICVREAWFFISLRVSSRRLRNRRSVYVNSFGLDTTSTGTRSTNAMPVSSST